MNDTKKVIDDLDMAIDNILKEVERLSSIKGLKDNMSRKNYVLTKDDFMTASSILECRNSGNIMKLICDVIPGLKYIKRIGFMQHDYLYSLEDKNVVITFSALPDICIHYNAGHPNSITNSDRREIIDFVNKYANYIFKLFDKIIICSNKYQTADVYSNGELYWYEEKDGVMKRCSAYNIIETRHKEKEMISSNNSLEQRLLYNEEEMKPPHSHDDSESISKEIADKNVQDFVKDIESTTFLDLMFD